MPDQQPLDASSPTTCSARDEYIAKLTKWLDDARLWHGYCSSVSALNARGQLPFVPVLSTSELLQNVPLNGTLSAQSPFVRFGFRSDVYECTIPPMWKRISAELMDFLILFLIKLAFTFVVFEGFNMVIEVHGIDSFQKHLQNPKILTLELVHRAIACAYEAYFLKGGMCATPGKRYMGLMVVNATNVVPAQQRPNETVRVLNIQPLGWKKSIMRSLLKNIFIWLMLPWLFAVCLFRHNRTGYDVMVNSIVVQRRRLL